MDQLFWSTLALVADNADLQEKVTAPAAAFVKSKLPGVADKAIGDFFVRLGKELGGA